MTELAVIADDLTGACDVGSSFASAGIAARVVCTHDGDVAPTDAVVIRNTQSRGLAAEAAAVRVRDVLRRSPAPLVLKKIDTALRGHLGAELDATLDALGALATVVVAAIPAAGRVTRDGVQFIGGQPLAATEFARDPEGPGAESSIAAVIARESRRTTSVVGLADVRSDALGRVLGERVAAGVRHLVIDAETDADVLAAARAVVTLPRPLCVAGSVAIASALVEVGVDAGWLARDHAASVHAADAAAPALVVCGSLHSTARAQSEALVAALGARLLRPAIATDDAVAAAAREAAGALTAGRTVVVAAPATGTTPSDDALRATEAWLAALTAAIVRLHVPRTLVLIGGETSHAVLRALGATHLDVLTRFQPLVAVARIATGAAAGTTLVTKGGSGGDADSLVALLTTPRGGRDAVAAVR